MVAAKRTVQALTPDEPSDAELARAAAAGDAAAFTHLYRRYVAKVRSTLLRLAGPAHLDDMTQDAFVRIWRGLAQLRVVETVSAWIYRVAVSVAMDQLRSAQRIKLQVLVDTERLGADERNAYESRQLVEAALEALDFPHRAVLVLHDLEQLTEAEVADALAIPRGTVKSRLFHARRRAREFLEKKGAKP